jgi:DNA-binding beta-propeller fold protein YncE
VTTLAGQATAGFNNATGINAQFNNPEGLAVGYGYVIVADSGNDMIRMISDSSGVVSTEAGQAGVTGAVDGTVANALFNMPSGVAVDSSGQVFVADTGNNMIRFYNGASVTTLAGQLAPGYNDATGTAAQFKQPMGIATNSYGLSGYLYIADSGNNMIRVLDMSTGAVTTLAGQLTPGANNGIGTAASFQTPTGVALDGNGHLFVADSGNNLIREIFISTGLVTTLAGSGSPGSTDGNGYQASFNKPYGIAVNSSGTTVYVADTTSGAIRQVAF